MTPKRMDEPPRTPPKGRRVLLSEHMSFEFYTDSSERYFLEVLCGGIGMFNMCIALTDDELERYREWGDYFIQKLALDIQRSPNSFVQRAIQP